MEDPCLEHCHRATSELYGFLGCSDSPRASSGSSVIVLAERDYDPKELLLLMLHSLLGRVCQNVQVFIYFYVLFVSVMYQGLSRGSEYVGGYHSTVRKHVCAVF